MAQQFRPETAPSTDQFKMCVSVVTTLQNNLNHRKTKLGEQAQGQSKDLTQEAKYNYISGAPSYLAIYLRRRCRNIKRCINTSEASEPLAIVITFRFTFRLISLLES